MKLTTDYAPLMARIDRAHNAAAQDTLADVVANQVKRTGRLAASFRLIESAATGNVTRVSIASSAVYANAVEHGANVGRRRGPHMKGNHVVLVNGPRFVEHMTARLSAS